MIPQQTGSPKKIAATLLALIALGLALSFLPVLRWVQDLRTLVASAGWMAPLIYVLLYIAFSIFLIPTMALGWLSGAVFGLALGYPMTILGSNIGSLCSFTLARTFLRQRAENLTKENKRVEAVVRAVDESGVQIVVLLRLSPFIPFTVINYVMGLTRMPMWKYAAATLFGMLPGNFLFVYAGYLGVDLIHNEAPPYIRVLQLAGLLATLIVCIIITRKVRKRLTALELVEKID